MFDTLQNAAFPHLGDLLPNPVLFRKAWYNHEIQIHNIEQILGPNRQPVTFLLSKALI